MDKNPNKIKKTVRFNLPSCKNEPKNLSHNEKHLRLQCKSARNLFLSNYANQSENSIRADKHTEFYKFSKLYDNYHAIYKTQKSNLNDENEKQKQKQNYIQKVSKQNSANLITQILAKPLAQNAPENRTIQPQWHAPWKLKRIISGHYGWVRAVAVDVSNDWFVTGSSDRTIKIWDLASGTLKLTLTGHTSTIRGLTADARHPYIFSCSEDKTVRCWDFEQNKVVRKYHGHLSGVYGLSLHPVLDVLVSCGRDATARVWDVRTKAEIFVLGGHKSTVACVATQQHEPQIITGSHDQTIRTWDLRTGTSLTTLTHHKKSIRDLQIHHKENVFISAAADALKAWRCPEAEYLRDVDYPGRIINTLTSNLNDVLVGGGDEGSLLFWDYKTGHNFQTIKAPPQPGSLESEAGIYDATFDLTGTRLITCEADKTVKIWKEDEEATPETHPVDYKPKKRRR